MIQKVLLVWTDVFPARAQNKNTDEEAFRKCAEPHSRRSNTLRRSFRRTETKSGVVSGESQKMSAEGAMHSCCAESLRQKDRVRRSTKTGSYGFYFSGPCSPDGRMVFSWEERGTSGGKGDIKS